MPTWLEELMAELKQALVTDEVEAPYGTVEIRCSLPDGQRPSDLSIEAEVGDRRSGFGLHYSYDLVKRRWVRTR